MLFAVVVMLYTPILCFPETHINAIPHGTEWSAHIGPSFATQATTAEESREVLIVDLD